MKAKLLAVGNSDMVRIPKAFIKKTKANGTFEMQVHGDTIVLRPARRNSLEEEFKESFAKYGPPELDQEFLNAPLLDDSDLPPW